MSELFRDTVSYLVLDDLDKPIRGAKAIRAARGNVETVSQIFYGLGRGTIPATKRGRLYETTLRRLKNHSSGEPTADNASTSSAPSIPTDSATPTTTRSTDTDRRGPGRKRKPTAAAVPSVPSPPTAPADNTPSEVA
jgi:hypothetical protein